MSDQAALDTYRTLRAGMVAAGILLGLGLIGYIVGHGVPNSISATFYTDLRTIFVTTLLAVGLALVAVKGRPGPENTLLDIAGVLIPVVGFVPTPITDPTCPVPGKGCIPAALDSAIDLNLWAYLGMGVIGLAVAGVRMGWASRTSMPWSRGSRVGLGLLALIWAIYAGTYLLARPFFVQYAHYTSAISFFLLLIGAVWINSRRTRGNADLARLPVSAYRQIYRAIAVAMVAAIGVGVAVFMLTGNQNAVVGDRFPVVFWIEAVLLLLFVTYWVFQTVELWFVTQPQS